MQACKPDGLWRVRRRSPKRSTRSPKRSIRSPKCSSAKRQNLEWILKKHPTLLKTDRVQRVRSPSPKSLLSKRQLWAIPSCATCHHTFYHVIVAVEDTQMSVHTFHCVMMCYYWLGLCQAFAVTRYAATFPLLRFYSPAIGSR